ncbi:MAG: ATP-binding protein [Nanoarchaeota archaeon]
MELRTIKESNPWWDNEDWEKNDLHLSNIKNQKIIWKYEIIKDLDNGIFSIRGPRQVGKTSYIKQLIKELNKKIDPKNILFYSCDNINKNELEELLNLFFDFSENGKKYIFLDEIPFVEDWEIIIKHYYDLGKFKDSFVLVCGSNSIDIKKSVERLPGRGDFGKRHFIMFPLTFKEYLKAINFNLNLTGKIKKDEAIIKLNFKEIQKEYENYLLTGGFIKIINEYYENKNISDYSYDIYLKWIIGDLAKLNLKEKYAKQLLRRVIETYTSEVSWSSLRSGTDIDTHNTAAKYLESLEEMFILDIIYKMDYNKKIPDYPKSKKIYFSDPFILSCVYKWVYGIEGNFLRYKNNFFNDYISKISEGVFLNHLIKLLINRIKSNVFNYQDHIFYWSNKQKTKEIDFIIDDIAFEIKYQNNINQEDYRGLNEFKKSYLLTKKTFNEKTYPLSAFLLLDKEIKIIQEQNSSEQTLEHL